MVDLVLARRWHSEHAMTRTRRTFGTLTILLSALLAGACSSDGDGPFGGGDLPGDDDDGSMGDDGDDGDGDDGSSGDDGSEGGDSGVVLGVCASGDADHATLADAIAAAPSGSVIEVCPGTYAETLRIDDKRLDIRCLGGAADTILDAGGAGIAIDVRTTGGSGVLIEGFTIRGGEADQGRGGGVRCEDSTLHLIDSTVRENHAEGGGGGLYAFGCEIEVAGVTFEANDGGDGGGGAFLSDATGELATSTFRTNTGHNGGALRVHAGTVLLRANDVRENTAWRGAGLYHDSDAPVEDNVFADNAAGWTGGGIHLVDSAAVLMRNVVQDNTSDNDGGGIYVHQGTVTLMDGTVVGNWCGDDGAGIRLFESRSRVESNLIANNESAGDGGGIRVSHQPSLFLDNTIRNNQAAGAGGGLDMDNDSSVVRGGVIEDNTAWRGGGIHAVLFPWRDAAFEGVRIADNNAGYGGGIYLEDNFYPIAIRDVVLVDNEANHGGGLFVRATDVTIRNTLISGNVADDDGGGLYVGQPEPYEAPMCPCPPLSPSIDVDFVVFHGNQAPAGAAVWVDTTGLSVGSSIITGHTGEAVTVAGVATPAPAWAYNDTTPASFAGMADPTGSSGNISSDPEYAGGAESFDLAAGSPCINAGDPAFNDRNGTRADMGRYGGPEAP